MTAVVRQLRRTTIPDTPATARERQDYCQCGRGPIIGSFAVRAGGANNRLAFFPIGSIFADWPEHAADLRCLDCVSEAVAALASGETDAELQRISRERHKQLSEVQPSGDVLPDEETSLTASQGQTSPSKGDQVT
jgi:hypothetical protein